MGGGTEEWDDASVFLVVLGNCSHGWRSVCGKGGGRHLEQLLRIRAHPFGDGCGQEMPLREGLLSERRFQQEAEEGRDHGWHMGASKY